MIIIIYPTKAPNKSGRILHILVINLMRKYNHTLKAPQPLTCNMLSKVPILPNISKAVLHHRSLASLHGQVSTVPLPEGGCPPLHADHPHLPAKYEASSSLPRTAYRGPGFQSRWWRSHTKGCHQWCYHKSVGWTIHASYLLKGGKFCKHHRVILNILRERISDGGFVGGNDDVQRTDDNREWNEIIEFYLDWTWGLSEFKSFYILGNCAIERNVIMWALWSLHTN